MQSLLIAQLEGNLTSDEERELEALERENMKTSEEVYQRLRGDDSVQALGFRE